MPCTTTCSIFSISFRIPFLQKGSSFQMNSKIIIPASARPFSAVLVQVFVFLRYICLFLMSIPCQYRLFHSFLILKSLSRLPCLFLPGFHFLYSQELSLYLGCQQKQKH